MPTDELKIKKEAKRFSIYFTVAYIILFPLFWRMGQPFPEMILESLSTPPTLLIVLSIQLPFLLIPLSVPVNIYLIWSRYLRGQYEKNRFFCSLPLFILAGLFLIIESFRVFFLLF